MSDVLFALQNIAMMVKMIMIINDCNGIVMEIILADTCQTNVCCLHIAQPFHDGSDAYGQDSYDGMMNYDGNYY